MKTQEIAIDKLIPYEKNTKKHDETQIHNVAKSIEKYGFVQPIVIDKDNVIIIGHCRYLAAKELEMKTVPCISAEHLTRKQVKELRIADNKTNESAWDFDLLEDEMKDIDFSDFDFDFGMPSQIDWDDVPEISEQNYEKPEFVMLECPSCHHVDRDIHFKKV